MKICIILKRKIIQISAAAVLLFICCPQSVYAGDINGNESSVLSVISGTFESNGHKYKAASGYVSQARSYFSEDGVDLTSEQAQEAIQMVYANIATGIEDGYLTLVDDVKAEETKNADKSEDDKSSESTENPKNTGKSDITQNSGQSNSPETEQKKNPKKVNTYNIRVENNEKSSALVVRDAKDELVLKLPEVIKNTGFSIQKTIIMAGIFLISFVIFLCRSFQRYLFARQNE